jgi:c-di-GMP-binding flagellar brake protein YcgR
MKFVLRMPLPENMERRQTRRVEAIAYVREHPEETNRFYYVRDISESGAFLLSSKPPEIGKIIKLLMNIRLVKETILLTTEVIRKEERGFAVTFIDMSEVTRKNLRSALYGNLKESIISKFQEDH